MHSAVEDHGRGHALQSERADEGGGLPVPMTDPHIRETIEKLGIRLAGYSDLS